ncbi:MAG TPA: class I SAM-dependent methyltransferase [Gaiellales bacterium]|nr:class I SAM-dependent methyltransferase [Gaiellales bacterium]
MRLDDHEFVRGQYRSPERLETRMSVWQPGPDGRTPQDVALSLLAAAAPGRLLEAGCGTGALAGRCAGELRCEVTALDASPEMVRATRARGIDAVTGDVQELPFPDGAFDCAVAAWMLYHVPDLDRGVAELARVLRPGGRLAAITNGRESLAELYDLTGGERRDSAFSGENGADVLGRHFARVERHDVEVRAVFADRTAAAAYLETLERGDLAARLPADMGRLVARGATTVFAADTPA